MQKKYITAIIGTTALSALASTHAQAATTHTVKSGESVWSISHKYGISIAKLKSLNGLTSNLIFPNQVLKVSGSSSEQRQQIVAQFIQLKLEIHYLLLLQNTVQLIKKSCNLMG